MLETIFIYVIVSSVTLVYGIGLKKLYIFSIKPHHILAYFIKSLLSIAASISLTWSITNYLLAPFDLSKIYPFFAILFTIFFCMIFQRFIFASFKIDTAEFTLTFLTVIVAVGEAVSFPNAMVIGLSCCISFYLLIPVLEAIRNQIGFLKNHSVFSTETLIFISFALIIFAFFSWNVSWLNLGVYK
ncbi:MAG: hypothetical protein BKP49_01735 [Treponema sp. CETP13]|nr:MAG: hypothetical protein BKP49_01735 [Treponema sp. CETP13]